MGRIQQQARRQQRLEELCGAAVRALTGQADLHIRARGLYRGRRRIPLHAPHLRTDPDRDDLSNHRGASDGMALRLRNSDADLHLRLCPAEPVQRLVFEMLEQLRVESLVPEHLPGMAHNLDSRFAGWSRDFHQIHEASRAIEAGRVWVNCYHLYPAHASFGGYKKSGIGRETHKMMLEHYRNTKNILMSLDKNSMELF